MFRIRRYRVFVVLAALTVFLLYRFSQPSQWEEATTSAAAIKDRIGLGFYGPGKSQSSSLDVDKKKAHPQLEKTDHETPNPPKIPAKQPEKVPPPPPEDIPKPVQSVPPPKTGDQKAGEGGIHQNHDKFKDPSSPSKTEVLPSNVWPPPPVDDSEIVLAPIGQESPQGSSRVEPPKEKWLKTPDHYPVPTESIIPLPTGKGKAIPKIQHVFKKESAETRVIRLQRLETVKEAFQHAWTGYKTRAWGTDELKPVTGKSRNTFNGWSATLVDSLDTMWILGLKKEFEEAVEFVKGIDFYSSTRSEIPVFETTIRYLGGLLGAYDVSDGKYPVLLDRARDLGDLLMAAFDTPNRMPMPYYPWQRPYVSHAHRSYRAVLAEIGSLQMEFTRLAQLTGNNSYYDAITRVVDALEVFQENTTLPGIWPADIDTSGCAKSQTSYNAPSRDLTKSFTYPQKAGVPSKKSDIPPMVPLEKPPPLEATLKDADPKHPLPEITVVPNKADQWAPFVPKDPKDVGPMNPLIKPDPIVFKPKPAKDHSKRDTPDYEYTPKTIPEPGLQFTNRAKGNHRQDEVVAEDPLVEEPCEHWGLAAASGQEKYTLGSTSDSAFEYLTKQYLLLNGQVEKYRKMYERAMDGANDNLIFRVMIKDSKREIYVSGEVLISNYRLKPERTFQTEESHLVCFVGGMMAMGAKIFDRPKDLEIAQKLTDGCVWSYESTASGIMPETFEVVKCDNRASCSWNETKWYEEIDPDAEMRMEMYEEQMKNYNIQLAQLASESAANAAAATPAPTTNPDIPTLSNPARAVVTEAQDSAREPPAGFDPSHNPPPNSPRVEHEKRQVYQASELAEDSTPDWPAPKRTFEADGTPTRDESTFQPPTFLDDAPPPIWSPVKPQSRDEFVKAAIARYHLKPGMRSIRDPRYILRPEAIESVFYMHRITGDPYWREVGWRMVSSVLTASRTQYGHSSIVDVTSRTSVHADEMESFWLAETLKYAWLLFEEEDKWSLDDWVFNTEAHLFRRPKAV